jgi:hypothetical protein
VVTWIEDGFWFRQMIDWLSDDRLIFADYKTTDESAAPDALARKMVNDGWHIQAAMGERGLDELCGWPQLDKIEIRPGAVEPSAVAPIPVRRAGGDRSLCAERGRGRAAMPSSMGRKMLDAAAITWARCMRARRWPGYPLEVVKPEFPGWAEQRWLDREISDAARERLPEDGLMAG